ncbi:hypothetical protein Golomagni_05329 [Golovinomyces magnicellulatus]|nr:hypothetical protein Golomagni_05329 [Golovinomyces magnicellulatus]
MIPMQLAQHSNPFFTNLRNHWESNENTAYRPTPKPPVQSTQPHNMIVYSWDDYMDLPPRELPTSPVSANLHAQFIKILRQTDNFTGDPYNLGNKTRHFLSFASLFWLILNGKAQQFFLTNIGRKDIFRGIKKHHQYYTDRKSSTFTDMRRKMKDSSFSEALEAFIEKRQMTQRALSVGYQDDGQLCIQIITNYRGVPELDQALFNPSSTSQELFAKLHSAATIYGDQKPTGLMQETEE